MQPFRDLPRETRRLDPIMPSGIRTLLRGEEVTLAICGFEPQGEETKHTAPSKLKLDLLTLIRI